jgi:hypothetical protein
MTSFIDSIANATMYGLAWLVISCGCTFIIAAAFFGFPEEIEPPEPKLKKNFKCPVVTVIREKCKENQDDT